MNTYCVRIGTRRARKPGRNPYEIGYREAEDDGAVILWAGDHTPKCSDCCCGHLLWAEAGYMPGYMPWHRICDVCGSHWDLHPTYWGPTQPSDPGPKYIPTGRFRCGHDVFDPLWRDECGPKPTPIFDEVPAPEFTRFKQCGEVPLDPAESFGDSGKTWGDLLALLTSQMWEEAEQNQKMMAGFVVIPVCWAHRARFFLA